LIFKSALSRCREASALDDWDGEIVTLSVRGRRDIPSEKKTFMNAAKINPRKRNVFQKIASDLRKDPKKIHLLANRLRSNIGKAKSSDEVSDNHWEWYAILTLWPPQEVIKLLEDTSNSAARFRRTSPLLSLLSEDEKAKYFALTDGN
jgi:hypothetical protein